MWPYIKSRSMCKYADSSSADTERLSIEECTRGRVLSVSGSQLRTHGVSPGTPEENE